MSQAAPPAAAEAPRYTRPLPVIEPLTRPYWDHARAHRLAVQCCTACGDRRFPPSPVCPRCLSDDQRWQVASGRGTLVSWATFHRAYWPAYADGLPYDVIVVRLAEGPLVVSNFHGSTPAGVHIGMALQAVFDDVTPEVSLVKFVVATEGAR